MTAARVAAALAAALAAAPAAAYVRTRAVTTGVELAWRVPVVPWTVNRAPFDAVDPELISSSCRASAAGDPGLAAVRASFAAWEQPCAELQLPYAGTLPEIRVGTLGSSENLLVFRQGWCSSVDPACADPEVDCAGIYNCFQDLSSADRSIVALTSVLYDPRSGRIYDADIEINGWDGADPGSAIGTQPAHGWYFTCYPDAQPSAPCTTYGQGYCRFIDLRNTVTHEVGHVIGLAHAPQHAAGAPEDSWSTMEAQTNVGDTWMRSLAPDDVAGVCAIYPSPGGGCGCGSGGAPGMLAVLVAVAALRRPRRS